MMAVLMPPFSREGKTMKTQNRKNQSDETVEVLYQKLGDRWFAFSLVDDEVLVGSITQDEIDKAEQKARALALSKIKMPEA